MIISATRRTPPSIALSQKPVVTAVRAGVPNGYLVGGASVVHSHSGNDSLSRLTMIGSAVAKATVPAMQ